MAAQQHQPLLRLFPSTNGGVTARTAAVVQRHEGKEPDNKRLGIGLRRRTAPSDRGRFSIVTRQELMYKELDLTDDFVLHGDRTRLSSRYGGEYFPPGSFTTLACTVWTDPRRLKSHPEGEKTAISPSTFQSSTVVTSSTTSSSLAGGPRSSTTTSIRRHSRATSREGRLSDCEILEEPRKIITSVTTGKHQLEGDASCVITGAIIDKLE